MSILEMGTVPQITKLTNGLRVATMKIKGDFSTLGYWVKSGSLYETAENNGVSHYLEHIIFKGSDRFSEQQLTDIADRKGINIMASTSRATTNFYSQVTNDCAGLATEILSDMVLNPKLLDSAIENERPTILQEGNEVAHDLNEVLWDSFHKTAYPQSSAGRPILGSTKNIMTLTGKQIKEHHKKFFDRDNMYFVAATELPHEQVCEMVEKATKFLKPRAERPKNEILPSDDSIWSQKFVSDSCVLGCGLFKDEAMVALGFETAPLVSRDFSISLIFKSVFAEKRFCRFASSPLIKDPTLFDIHSRLVPYANSSLFIVFGQTTADDILKSSQSMIKSMSDIVADDKVAEMAKLNAKFSFGFQMVSPLVVADETGMNLLLRGRMKPLNEWYKEIDSITQDELEEHYFKYFYNKVPSIVAIVPPNLMM